jgi:hypothetical protein
MGHIRNRAGRIPQEKSEKEAEEKRAARAHRAPYNKIREALEELETLASQQGTRITLRSSPDKSPEGAWWKNSFQASR